MAKKQAERAADATERARRDADQSTMAQREEAQRTADDQARKRQLMMAEEARERQATAQALRDEKRTGRVDLNMELVVLEYVDPQRAHARPFTLTFNGKTAQFGIDVPDDDLGRWEAVVPAYFAQEMITMHPQSWAFGQMPAPKTPGVVIPESAKTGAVLPADDDEDQADPAIYPVDEQKTDFTDEERMEKFGNIPKVRTVAEAESFIKQFGLKREGGIVRSTVRDFERLPSIKHATAIDSYISKIMTKRKSDAVKAKTDRNNEVMTDAKI